MCISPEVEPEVTSSTLEIDYLKHLQALQSVVISKRLVRWYRDHANFLENESSRKNRNQSATVNIRFCIYIEFAEFVSI